VIGASDLGAGGGGGGGVDEEEEGSAVEAGLPLLFFLSMYPGSVCLPSCTEGAGFRGTKVEELAFIDDPEAEETDMAESEAESELPLVVP